MPGASSDDTVGFDAVADALAADGASGILRPRSVLAVVGSVSEVREMVSSLSGLRGPRHSSARMLANPARSTGETRLYAVRF